MTWHPTTCNLCPHGPQNIDILFPHVNNNHVEPNVNDSSYTHVDIIQSLFLVVIG